jgi:hypothetical protein
MAQVGPARQGWATQVRSWKGKAWDPSGLGSVGGLDPCLKQGLGLVRDLTGLGLDLCSGISLVWPLVWDCLTSPTGTSSDLT